MHDWIAPAVRVLAWICLVPAFCGSLYCILTMISMIWLRRAPVRHQMPDPEFRPSVTILKPVHGLEKNQRENLRSTCMQDYPDFQVVFSAQDLDDPVIPLLLEIQKEFGADRVSVAVEQRTCGPNGKINNMVGGLPYAKHEILVISDSDIRLRPDYLKSIVSPLADPSVGCACTLYKVACADTWYEKFELLTLNAELMPNMVFAHVTGFSKFCLGASMALRQSTLREIGGLESLADYLVEDFEIGRRIWSSEKKVAIVPYLVETIVDLKSPSDWWSHFVYWDQNHRSARPIGFFATALIRSVPFALLYMLLSLGANEGLVVLAGALAVRLVTAGVILGWGLRDREGLRSLWLLPFRDLVALVVWAAAQTKGTTIWRGREFDLTRDGRLVARVDKSQRIAD